VNDTDLIEVSCPRCQKLQRIPRDQAGKRVPCSNPSCRTPIEIAAPAAAPEKPAVRYPLLHTLIGCFYLLGVLSLIWAVAEVVFGVIGALGPERAWQGLLPAFGAALVGLVGGAGCLAAAELSRLAMDVEASTRSLRTTASPPVETAERAVNE
jgi:hypothetical protein